MNRAIIGSLALLLALSACGGGSEDNESSDQREPASTTDSMPSCADIWVDGATLPAKYEGCMTDDSIVAAVTTECADGSEFTTYDDRFHAVLGGPIVEADSSSKDYAAAFEDCAG